LQWLIIVAVILLVVWWGWAEVKQFVTFVNDRAAVTAYVQGFGNWGPLLLLALLSSQVILAFIPGHIIMITSGYLYGFWGGLGLNLLGTVVAGQLAFGALRWAGRPLLTRLISTTLLERWDRLAQRAGFTFFLLFFWFPVLPSNVMNFVAALSPISVWYFLAANFLGRLPGVTLITLIGSHGLELSTQQWFILAGVGVILFIGGRYAANRVQARYFVVESGPVTE
jgi:uncharacterized membrane protein YdjX (TVP38/TMEM64 family)